MRRYTAFTPRHTHFLTFSHPLVHPDRVVVQLPARTYAEVNSASGGARSSGGRNHHRGYRREHGNRRQRGERLRCFALRQTTTSATSAIFNAIEDNATTRRADFCALPANVVGRECGVTQSWSRSRENKVAKAGTETAQADATRSAHCR